MKPYEKYKEIDAPWLVRIPEDWQSCKIRYSFDERSEKGHPNELLLSATQSRGVIPQSLYESRTVSALKDFHLLKLVEKGDFVISLRSFQGGIEYAYYRGVISPAYTIMNPRSIIDRGYFKYLAKSIDFIKLLTTCVTGIREGQNIDYKLLKKNIIPIPSIDEQLQIVRFLGWKVAMVNKFVKAKKREIALLKELKQAEINRAVTRGLNPDFPLKDSGIDWIGQVPEDWEVVRLKRDFSFRKGLSITKDNLVEYGIPVISYGQIHSKSNRSLEMSKELIRYVPKSYLESGKDALAVKNDFIFADTSEDLAGTGNFVRVSNIGFLFAGYHTIIVSTKEKNDTSYVAYLFLTDSWRSQLRKKVNGIKLFSISQLLLKQTTIILPPPLEQQQIVMHIQTIEERINKAMADIEQEIELVKEYKTRLVSDVVTGKVDVRSIEIPSYQPEAEDILEKSADKDL